MTKINTVCADVGTANCPCPLAETGDCLICSRLSNRGSCDCQWAGLCIYNEFIQNGGKVIERRSNRFVDVVSRKWYGGDLVVLALDVGRSLAQQACEPGSFVFIKPPDVERYFEFPVSVMKADVQRGYIYVAIKVISAKTRAVAETADKCCGENVYGQLELRGIYRNGLIGKGATSLASTGRSRWLVITKGVGLAPAINLLDRAGATRIEVDMIVDAEKVSDEFIRDCLEVHIGIRQGNVRATRVSLEKVVEKLKNMKLSRKENTPFDLLLSVAGYDKVMILASDYYVSTLARILRVPDEKLVFANNFHMCCGEGICGACGHTDAQGGCSKMCKCGKIDVRELL